MDGDARPKKKPIARLLQETRIHQAKRKLVETTPTLTDISYEGGYADAVQSSRLFKEATGMTPTSYRESMATSPHDL